MAINYVEYMIALERRIQLEAIRVARIFERAIDTYLEEESRAFPDQTMSFNLKSDDTEFTTAFQEYTDTTPFAKELRSKVEREIAERYERANWAIALSHSVDTDCCLGVTMRYCPNPTKQ